MRNLTIPVAFYGTFAIIWWWKISKSEQSDIRTLSVGKQRKKTFVLTGFSSHIIDMAENSKMSKCFSYQPSELMTLKITWKLHNLAQVSISCIIWVWNGQFHTSIWTGGVNYDDLQAKKRALRDVTSPYLPTTTTTVWELQILNLYHFFGSRSKNGTTLTYLVTTVERSQSMWALTYSNGPFIMVLIVFGLNWSKIYNVISMLKKASLISDDW